MKLLEKESSYLINEIRDNNIISSYILSSEANVYCLINNGLSNDINGRKIYVDNKNNKFEVMQNIKYIVV